MSEAHLDLLRLHLEEQGWSLTSTDGDDREISAYWHLVRSTKKEGLVIAFEGFDELGVLPVEKAYGCHVQGEELALYFGSQKEFKKNLPTFLDALDDLER